MIADKTMAMAYYLAHQEMCATVEEILLVTDINGWNEGTMKEILWARCAYNDFDQLPDWEGFLQTWYENDMPDYEE